jgi:hypothetical protein
VNFNGKPVLFSVQTNGNDQHVIVKITVAGGSNSLRIRIENDFGLSYNGTMPEFGETSRVLRILSETWTPTRDRLTIRASAVAGKRYDLSIWNPEQMSSVSGGKIEKDADGKTKLIIEFPKAEEKNISETTVSIQFKQAAKGPSNAALDHREN